MKMTIIRSNGNRFSLSLSLLKWAYDIVNNVRNMDLQISKRTHIRIRNVRDLVLICIYVCEYRKTT